MKVTKELTPQDYLRELGADHKLTPEELVKVEGIQVTIESGQRPTIYIRFPRGDVLKLRRLVMTDDGWA